MRVTENTNYDTIRGSIGRSKSRLEKLQMQSATLKRINQPSEDPIGSAKLLEMRTEKVNNDQYLMNSKVAEAFLSNTEHALTELAEVLSRAKEIAIGQSSGASSNDDTRLGVAEEVKQLGLQAIATANRRIGDRYLFGGYKTTQPPVDNEGRFQGDDGQIMVEIGRDIFVTMNMSGLEAFNTEPALSADTSRMRAKAQEDASAKGLAFDEAPEEALPRGHNLNVFQELQGFRIALLSGDIEEIRASLDRFDTLHGRMVAMRAKIGSRIQGIQSATQANERHGITNAVLTSQIEDADMAQVMSDMAKEETIFRSSLQSAQKLVQPKLIDFLR